MSAWGSGRLRGPLEYGLRPVRGGLALATQATRFASAAAADAAGRIALAGLDTMLDWHYTDEALRRALASPAADHAVAHVLRGPLVDAVARDVTRYRVVDRLADGGYAGEALERALDRLLSGPVTD